jgi:epoxyqueuosine reductase QueG
LNAPLDARIAALLDERGALLFGVADLTAPGIHQEVVAQGGEWLGSFPRAISIAHRLQDGIVEELPDHHQEAVVARVYDFHIYRTVNDLLDGIADRIATEVQEAGFRAVPVPASQSVDPTGFRGAISHKLVARAAGLGWIGRSCLLITPHAGPRVRLVSVLTNAPLQAASPLPRDCGRCRICVDYCPAHAFTGEAFRPDGPLEERMDVRACHTYRQLAKESSGASICGVCVAVCPYGRSGS